MSTNTESVDPGQNDQDESLGLEQLPQTELDATPATGEQSGDRPDGIEALQERGAALFQTPNPARLQSEIQEKPLEERAASMGGEAALQNTEGGGGIVDPAQDDDDVEAFDVDESTGRTQIRSAFVRSTTD